MRGELLKNTPCSKKENWIISANFMNRNKCFSCSWCQPLSSTKQASIFGTLKYSVQLTAFYTGRESGTVISFIWEAVSASISLRAVQICYFILSPEIIHLEELYVCNIAENKKAFIKYRKWLQLLNSRLLSRDWSACVYFFLIHRNPSTIVWIPLLI